MERDKAPKPPLGGVIYGEITYWLVLLGVVVAVSVASRGTVSVAGWMGFRVGSG